MGNRPKTKQGRTVGSKKIRRAPILRYECWKAGCHQRFKSHQARQAHIAVGHPESRKMWRKSTAARSSLGPSTNRPNMRRQDFDNITSPDLRNPDMNGCRKLAAAVILHSLTSYPKPQRNQHLAPRDRLTWIVSLRKFADGELVGLFCSATNFDEDTLRKALRKRADQIEENTYGRVYGLQEIQRQLCELSSR